MLLEITLFILTVGVAIGYVMLISNLYTGWTNTPDWKTPIKHKPTTNVSVVIAARNEADHIAKLLLSISTNSYPKELYEIIVVDDSSNDNTFEIAQSLSIDNCRVLRAKDNIGKKKALALGLSHATGALVLCTDGDCIVGTKWISTIVSYYEKSKARLIAGPIQYHKDKSILQNFQYLDSINNMAVTANGVQKKAYYMANGANIAYEKSLFQEIGGFQDSTLASGDDMHMIQTAAERDPSSVRFLKSKDAIVTTLPQKNLKALFTQRKRWATKTSSYSDKRIIRIQGYVFGFVLLLMINLAFVSVGTGLSLFGFLLALFIKLGIDFLYLARLAEFFYHKDGIKRYIPASLCFLVYILLAGWWSIVPSSYEWKGRKTK